MPARRRLCRKDSLGLQVRLSRVNSLPILDSHRSCHTPGNSRSHRTLDSHHIRHTLDNSRSHLTPEDPSSRRTLDHHLNHPILDSSQLMAASNRPMYR